MSETKPDWDERPMVMPVPALSVQPPPLPADPTLFPPSLPPQRPPRVWPVYTGFAVLIAGMLGMGIAVGVYLELTLPAAEFDDRIDQILEGLTTPRMLAITGMLTSLVILAAAVIPALLSPERFRTRLGLEPARADWTVIAALSIAAVAWSEVLWSTMTLLGLDSEALTMISAAMREAEGQSLLLLVLAVGIAAPIAEELFCRGYVQTRLCRRHGAAAGILISSILFGIMHMELTHGFFAMLLGLFLGYTVLVAGSILPALIGHTLNNLSAVVLVRWLPGDEPDLALTWKIALGAAILLGVCLAWIWWRQRLPRGLRESRPPQQHSSGV